MEHLKNILSKLIVGKQISDQDIKKIIFGKNSPAIEKISKHLDYTVDVASALKNNPDILKGVIKNKLINEIFKYTKKKKI